MSGGVTAAPQSYSLCFPLRTPSEIHQRTSSVIPRVSRDQPLFSSNSKLFLSESQKFPRINLRCNSTGDNESRTILDAFFLGKAVGEAVSERLESAVGEFLSTVGRLQAEQQKQIQEFQEDVLEKAKRAKDQAAQEALDAQALISKPTAAATASNINGFTDTVSSNSITTQGSSSSVSKPTNEDLLSDLLNED